MCRRVRTTATAALHLLKLLSSPYIRQIRSALNADAWAVRLMLVRRRRKLA